MKVKLGKYKGLNYKCPGTTIKKEEINNYINDLRKKYQTKVKKNGPVREGDYVTIRCRGSLEGTHLPEFSYKSYHLKVGAGNFLKKFELNLVGKRVDETAEFDIVFTDDYELEDYDLEKYAGKTIHFKVKLLSVETLVIPELTDDVVKKFNLEGVNTISELKDHARDKIRHKKIMEKSTRTINKIMKQIISESEVKLKEEEVKRVRDEVLADFRQKLNKRNLNLKTYLSYNKKSKQEILEECRLEAETYLTEKAIIEKIAEKEDIIITAEEKQKYLQDSDNKEARNQLLYQKVVDFLLRKNVAIGE